MPTPSGAPRDAFHGRSAASSGGVSPLGATLSGTLSELAGEDAYATKNSVLRAPRFLKNKKVVGRAGRGLSIFASTPHRIPPPMKL
jgi:hypothetical protein